MCPHARSVNSWTLIFQFTYWFPVVSLQLLFLKIIRNTVKFIQIPVFSSLNWAPFMCRAAKKYVTKREAQQRKQIGKKRMKDLCSEIIMRENGPKSSLLTLLTPASCLPILPSYHPSIPGVCPGHGFPLCTSFCCFCSWTAGEKKPEGPRDMERNVWPKVLYEAISVPVKLRCSLHRLSSSLSVWFPKCLFSLALFPVFSFSGGKLGEHSALRRIHRGTVGATENEKMSLAGRLCVCGWREGAPPAYAPVSGRIWQLSCQQEVVATWWRNGKKGPLWTMPPLIETYPT